MSDLSRRDALRRIGMALMATGVIDRASAEEVHHLAHATQGSPSGVYTPKAFTNDEFRTLERLVARSRDGRARRGELRGRDDAAAGRVAGFDRVPAESDARAGARYRVLFVGAPHDRR